MSLLERAKHAVVWNALFNVFRDVLALAVMLVLVRLLEPEQYGEFAMVTAIVGLISVFAHQNFIAHTLQVRDENSVHYQDHFTAGGPIQLAMFLVTNLVAVGLQYSDSYAGISIPLHVMSIGFLLEWPCELRRKMLERTLDWKRLRLLHAIGLVASSTLAITMGLLGAGVYALLIPGLMVTVPFIVDLFFIHSWRPTWEWNRERYMPALRFGVSRLASGVVGRSRRLTESAVIVYILGFTSAGLFDRALSLGVMFSHRIAAQIVYTLYPVLTKLEPGTKDYRRAAGMLLRGVSWFAVPVTVVLAVLAAPIVNVVYGHRWDGVISLVPAAMVLGGVATILHVVYMLLLAHNEERRCVSADVLELVGTVGMLVWLLPMGLLTYLLGLLLVRILALSYGTFWLLSCKGIERIELSSAFFPAIMASGFAYSICECVLAVVGRSVDNAAEVIVYGVVFLVLYLIVIRIFFAKPLFELVNYLPASVLIGRFLFVRKGFA
jgi:O-antigen/teichoic acid export membrane protein